MTTQKSIRGRAFAFVFNWFKEIIALSLCLSKGALQHTVHTSIIAAEIIWLKFFSSSNISVRTWGSLEQNQQYKFGQWKMQTADRVQNVDCRLGTKCRLRIYTVFFAWYVVTCHLTTYRASRNRFSAIIFLDYFHYCGIFLARFLITIVLNIISSLPVVFSLCARGGWCGTCSEYTNLIKVDVDVNEMSLLNN